MSPQLLAALKEIDLARDTILEHLAQCTSDALEEIYLLTFAKNINRPTTNRALLAMVESGLITRKRHYRVEITAAGTFFITNISKLHERLHELEQCSDAQIEKMYSQRFDLLD